MGGKSLLFQPETSGIRTRSIPDNNSDTGSSHGQNMTTSNKNDSSTLVSSMSSPVMNQTEIRNDTYHSVTYPTTQLTTAAPHQSAGSAWTVMIVIIVLLAVSAAITLIYFVLKKRKFLKIPCYLPVTRGRRSSTSSSRRALEEHEVMEEHYRPKPEGQSDDMFTIDDLENNGEPTGGKEEYYYDEVFGKSQFEDEATNNAMRQLYSDSDGAPEEEMLDLDFETLGINMQDYSPDPDRKKNAV